MRHPRRPLTGVGRFLELVSVVRSNGNTVAVGDVSIDEVAAELASALGEHEAAAEVWQRLTESNK